MTTLKKIGSSGPREYGMTFRADMVIKPCPSFPGYSVSENGTVFSHRRRKKMAGKWGGSVAYIDPEYFKPMATNKNRKGYLSTGLRQNGRNRPIQIHAIVADAFLGPRPVGCQVRHLDGNNQNNHYSNLAYGTTEENAADRLRHGRYASGEKHVNAKLTFSQVQEIISLRKKRVKVKDLAQKFGVSKSTIADVIYGRSYL